MWATTAWLCWSRILHGDKNNLSVVALDDVVRRVGKQRIVFLGTYVGRRRPRLADGEADQRAVELDALRLQRIHRQLFRLERNAGSAVS